MGKAARGQRKAGDGGKIGRATAKAMSELVLRAGTKLGRQRLAYQFIRYVVLAKADRYCIDLAVHTWMKVNDRRHVRPQVQRNETGNRGK